jgi:large subunit ribosomal protein L19
MSQVVEKVQQSQLRQNLPKFRSGDTLRVFVRLKEGEEGKEGKERIQPFEGVVIKRSGRLAGETFTLRRVSFGIGVERIFPLHSPVIQSIEVVNKGRVRRSKLYYLRARKGKAARIERSERARIEDAVPVTTATE